MSELREHHKIVSMAEGIELEVEDVVISWDSVGVFKGCDVISRGVLVFIAKIGYRITKKNKGTRKTRGTKEEHEEQE